MNDLIHNGEFGIYQQPTTYDFNNYPIRIANRNGDPWFVALDVCQVLGIKNVSSSLSVIDGEEKDDIGFTDVTGRTQQMMIISESGFYRLVMRSNKPIAVPFQKWVTGIVIPSIRKHGAFVSPNATVQGVQQAAQTSNNKDLAELMKVLFDNLPNLGADAKQTLAGDLLNHTYGITIAKPITGKLWDMTKIIQAYNLLNTNTTGKDKDKLLTPIGAGLMCHKLKGFPNSVESQTTVPENPGQIVPQTLWNETGKALVDDLLQARGWVKKK